MQFLKQFLLELKPWSSIPLTKYIVPGIQMEHLSSRGRLVLSIGPLSQTQ